VRRTSTIGFESVGYQISQLTVPYGYEVILRDSDDSIFQMRCRGSKRIGKFYVSIGKITRGERVRHMLVEQTIARTYES
jgi:hypothetical protein